VLLFSKILVDELAGWTAKTPIKDAGSTDFDIIKLKHFSSLFITIHSRIYEIPQYLNNHILNIISYQVPRINF
jgi:hypothetical protein